MDYKKLLDETSDLILEPDFQDISRQNVISSALECVNTKEDCMCQLLSWLLNPKQGHLQGEYFLKKLISGIYQTETTSKLPEKTKALLNSYSNMQVMTEVAINEVDNKAKKRRIDILLADSNSKTLFIIERKDGSKAHSNQLAEYYRWTKEHYRDWDHFFIVLDSHKKNHGEQMHPEYVLLDDNWLTSAIKSLLKHNALPSHIEHTLQDIYDFVFNKWDESKDTYFKSRKKKILSIAHQYSKTINKLLTHVIELDDNFYVLSDISPTIYYSKLLPSSENKSFSHEQRTLFNLIQSNQDTISLIEDYSEFDQLSEQIVNIYPSICIETHENSLAFSLKKHWFNEDSYWPYYFEIERVDNEDNTSYNLNVCSNKKAHENSNQTRAAFTEIYAFASSRKNFQSKTLVEDIETLDFSYGTQLRSTIDTFIKNASSLPDTLCL